MSPARPLTVTATRRIATLCEQLVATAPAEYRARLERLDQRAGEPLHVAVAGRVKAGKSTFVNALLGQRVARTDARECTRVVTWFRYGPTDKVTIVARDGSRRRTRLDAEGLVPEDLGVPVAEVAAIEVELSLARLRSFTLADTPGLASADTSVSRQTEDLLGVDPDSEAVIAGAEAVLFVMNQTVRQSDVDVLRGFRAISHRAGNDAVSAFAVLNKADLFDGPDPMATGARIAARHAGELRVELAGVLAYSGLFAEAALCGVFTEGDAQALEALAALEPAQRDRLLMSESTFCRTPGEVDEPTRRRLWAMLREGGLRSSFEAVDAGAIGAIQLRDHLHARSGHRAVDAHITDLFEANAPALKATAALDDLEAIAWAAGGAWGATLRDRIEALRLDPDLHVLAELAVLRQVRRGEVHFPDELAAELATLVATPVDGRVGSDESLRRWHSYANSGISPADAHAARVVLRSCEIATERGMNR
jgi:GTPase SAR1 family protein